MPGFIAKLFIPANRFATLRNRLFKTHRMDHFWHGFTPFIPSGTEWLIFTRADCIFQTKFDRVQSKRAGNILQVPVKRPIPLRHAITAISSSGGSICINDVRVEADVGMLPVFAITYIQAHRLLPGITCNSQRMAAISARIRKRCHLVCCHRAIQFYASFHVNSHRMP